MIPEGSKVTMTAGSKTYEYVAGKALPFNKEPRDWIYEVPLDAFCKAVAVPEIPAPRG